MGGVRKFRLYLLILGKMIFIIERIYGKRKLRCLFKNSVVGKGGVL